MQKLRKNKGKAILALLAICALLSTGTFAWGQVSSVLNPFENKATSSGEIIDEFDPDTGDKDVGAKNTGETDLYVRMQLNEYMEVKFGGDAKYYDIMNAANSVTRDSSGKRTGDPEDGWWSTHSGVGTDCTECSYTGTVNGEAKGFHDFWDWTMGGSPTMENAKELTDGVVMTYADWSKLSDTAKNNVWVLCDDGYFYWSSPLASGEATGVLLNSVEKLATVTGFDYYYVIDARLEIADANDFGTMRDGGDTENGITLPGAGDEGKDILDRIKPGGNQPAEPTISSIEVTSLPTKVVYAPGETLDTTGMVVTATMSDGTTKVVTDYTATANLDSVGAATVTVAMNDGSATTTFDVTVQEPELTVSSIAVTTLPTKVSYVEGETLDTTGMVVTATMSDGSKQVVTNYTATADLSKAGTATVTVTMDDESGATTTFDVTVTAAGPEKLALLETETDRSIAIMIYKDLMEDEIEIEAEEWQEQYEGSKILTDTNSPVSIEIQSATISGPGITGKANLAVSDIIGTIKFEDGLLKPYLSPKFDKFVTWLELNPQNKPQDYTMDVVVKLTQGGLTSDNYTVHVTYNENSTMLWW